MRVQKNQFFFGLELTRAGNTYPDISLLPAIARLLKIDMNELFSFREELTEKEIGQFVNELSEVSLDSFIK